MGSSLHFFDFSWISCYEYKRKFSISIYHNIFSVMVRTIGYCFEFTIIRDKSVMNMFTQKHYPDNVFDYLLFCSCDVLDGAGNNYEHVVPCIFIEFDSEYRGDPLHFKMQLFILQNDVVT